MRKLRQAEKFAVVSSVTSCAVMLVSLAMPAWWVYSNQTWWVYVVSALYSAAILRWSWDAAVFAKDVVTGDYYRCLDLDE